MSLLLCQTGAREMDHCCHCSSRALMRKVGEELCWRLVASSSGCSGSLAKARQGKARLVPSPPKKDYIPTHIHQPHHHVPAPKWDMSRFKLGPLPEALSTRKFDDIHVVELEVTLKRCFRQNWISFLPPPGGMFTSNLVDRQGGRGEKDPGADSSSPSPWSLPQLATRHSHPSLMFSLSAFGPMFIELWSGLPHSRLITLFGRGEEVALRRPKLLMPSTNCMQWVKSF